MFTKPRSPLLGFLSGLVAAGFGLSIAELVAGIDASFQSPVLDVGDQVVDLVPAALKNMAIDLFGTNDKIALLVGIFFLLAIYAGILGRLAFGGRIKNALIGVGVFGAVGVVAALARRDDPSMWVALPTIVGSISVAAALVSISRFAEQDRRLHASEPTSRRAVVRGLAAMSVVGVAAAASGRGLANRFNASMSRVSIATREIFNRPRMEVPESVLAPVEGIRPFITPIDDFYRIDTALTVPQVAAETWTLRIHGMTDREIVLTYDDLLERELIEVPITLTCVSNEIGGSLLGTAVWGGVRLDDLLSEAGISPGADQIVGRSIDGFTGGFPVSVLDGRDAMIAVSMNGEPLPLEHGFPARLVIPGLYGYVSATKWLTEIELTTFDAFDAYWVPRGWSAEGPIKTQSRIDTPAALSTIAPGPVAIGGSAWSQPRGISRVEVQIDDGAWQDATLADQLSNVTWRQWFLEWDATVGSHTITVRATDGDGNVQTEERQEPMPNGATGWHKSVVLVKA